jgi:hypothetical protein
VVGIACFGSAYTLQIGNGQVGKTTLAQTIGRSGGSSPSLITRQAFIRTYLEHDVPRTLATILQRFWLMLDHLQGGLF